MNGEEKILLTVEDMMQITGLSRPSVYSLINSSGFPCLRVGRRYFVPDADFKAWLSERAKEKAHIVNG